ncbi:TetR family transcriptional regulator [Halopolyspora algeriensis]|uniref:TetR family transcriptional regulator n=1 Tax=Halopolyspora algeriensis TaxID=1500506 RepID=A0A368W2P9_9ACTN|nr:TetR/AcrR family transcriptional regulator [Halopolyspora algeriensis]RCW46963.1 TetR family transcriptional regulator [Halopolyspora algeriensis]TQM48054.1 TetR family transcriptional regulator [Halopolyspora algeriensis]
MAATQRRTGDARSAAERILTTASQLFYEHGIRATGVNTIAERAAVTKVTLYAHFGSKDGLVAAHLRARDQRWWAEFDEFLAGCTTGADRLRAMFDAYQAWALAGGFRGCGFVNAATELTAPEHPGHAIINDHKEGIRRSLEAFAAEAGCTHPAEAAEEWFLLLEGATVTASLRHSTEPLHRARRAALRRLDSASPQ